MARQRDIVRLIDRCPSLNYVAHTYVCIKCCCMRMTCARQPISFWKRFFFFIIPIMFASPTIHAYCLYCVFVLLLFNRRYSYFVRSRSRNSCPHNLNGLFICYTVWEMHRSTMRSPYNTTAFALFVFRVDLSIFRNDCSNWETYTHTHNSA